MTGSTTASPITGTAPLQVDFTVAGSGGLAPYTYSWDFGDGTTGSGASPSHSYGVGTFYPAVTVHDAAGGSWTASAARISALAPAGGGGGGSNGGGAPVSPGAPQPPASAPTAPPSQTPAPSRSPSASPTTVAGTTPAGNSGGNGPLLLTLLGSVLATGISGFLFAAWRRRRLG